LAAGSRDLKLRLSFGRRELQSDSWRENHIFDGIRDRQGLPDQFEIAFAILGRDLAMDGICGYMTIPRDYFGVYLPGFGSQQ
jgi:hypothetical protein